MKDQENLRQLRREWYHRNQEQESEKQRLRRLERAKLTQEFLIFLKESTPCKDCGKMYPHYVMDFDHLDPTVKSFNLASHNGSKSMKTIKAEIAKCEIVCSNCHRIRTWNRRVMV